MQCPRCGQECPDSATECPSCSHALRPRETVARRAASAPRSAPPREPSKPLEAVVGANADYYLPRFAARERGENRIGWHWPAFFFTFPWLLYRKMWLWAVLYSVVPGLVILVLLVMFSIAGMPIERAMTIAYATYYAGIFVLPPLFATAFYHRHCLRKIEQVKRYSSNPDWQQGWLSARGGTSRAALWCTLLLTLVCLLGIVAAIALPAYQDYAVRARVAEVTRIGYQAATDVAEFYARTRLLPRTIEESGFENPGSPLIGLYGLDPTDGSLELRLTFDPVRGGRLYFFPQVTGTGEISIVCASPDIPDKYLAPECR